MSTDWKNGWKPIEYRILDLFPMDEHGTGHIADCGYDANDERCDCYALPERIRAVLHDWSAS